LIDFLIVGFGFPMIIKGPVQKSEQALLVCITQLRQRFFGSLAGNNGHIKFLDISNRQSYNDSTLKIAN
jgi:hypothetical protein